MVNGKELDLKMYDGNSLAIGWSDIRDLGYKDWQDYLESLEGEDENSK